MCIIRILADISTFEIFYSPISVSVAKVLYRLGSIEHYFSSKILTINRFLQYIFFSKFKITFPPKYEQHEKILIYLFFL